MKLEALPQTNHIKSIVTLEDQIDLERKGQQSFQGVVYARLIAFGKRSSVRSSVKHRLTDVGEIPARAAHLDM